MAERLDVVVIGGGQSGLAVGHFLANQGARFAILDRGAEVGHTWRARWDSLRLITPQPYNDLPGLPFPRAAGLFPTKDETADYLKLYAETFRLPIRLGVKAQAMKRTSSGYAIDTGDGTLEAAQVVVATGAFQRPMIPALGEALPDSVLQLHSSEYRSPAQIPSGPVLVVGCGNSGAGIAKDLSSTHDVHLSMGERAWVPRTLLGRDIFYWLHTLKLMDIPIESRLGQRWSRSPDAVIGMNPEAMARACGVTLVGRTEAILAGQARFSEGAPMRPRTVIWSTGFKADYGWIDVPIFDARGAPIHRRGVTAARGLYFLGLKWQHTNGSSLLGGVGRDAAYIASRIKAERL